MANGPDLSLRHEIQEILISHAGQPVDFVAIYMFLNTAAGGHFTDRYEEDAIQACLDAMMTAGEIEFWQPGAPRTADPQRNPQPGSVRCFRLCSSGHSAE